MRTRNLDWLDTKTNTPWYGVEALVHGRWMPAYDISAGKIILFKSETERDIYRARLRKEKTIKKQDSAISKAKGGE